MNRNHQSLDEIEQEGKAEEKKKFNLFDRIRKEREEIPPDIGKVMDDPTLVNFFKLLARKITTLLYVNLMFIFGNFPIFFFLFESTGYTRLHSFAPYSQQYAPLLGASYYDRSPMIASLMGVFGIHADISLPTTASYVLWGLTGLLLLTWGAVNVGTTYHLRTMVREEGMFLWADFWYAIRKNLKQEIIYGIIDLGLMALLAYDFAYFYIKLGSGSTMIYILFFLTFAMSIVYAMMRMYIYLMMITFDLSIFKLLKNALFLTILGIKRNIMALLGIVVMIALDYVMLIVFFPVGVILPLILMFSVGGLMSAYAAWPKIKQYMIDPRPEEDDEGTEEAEEN